MSVNEVPRDRSDESAVSRFEREITELLAERNQLRRVAGTDYEVVAYNGEAHVVLHHPSPSWDEPPNDQLMGSVGDLIRMLDETTAKVERVRRIAEADRLGLSTYGISRDEIFAALTDAA